MLWRDCSWVISKPLILSSTEVALNLQMQLGFSVDWTDRVWQYWHPTRSGCTRWSHSRRQRKSKDHFWEGLKGRIKKKAQVAPQAWGKHSVEAKSNLEEKKLKRHFLKPLIEEMSLFWSSLLSHPTIFSLKQKSPPPVVLTRVCCWGLLISAIHFRGSKEPSVGVIACAKQHKQPGCTESSVATAPWHCSPIVSKSRIN